MYIFAPANSDAITLVIYHLQKAQKQVIAVADGPAQRFIPAEILSAASRLLQKYINYERRFYFICTVPVHVL